MTRFLHINRAVATGIAVAGIALRGRGAGRRGPRPGKHRRWQPSG